MYVHVWEREYIIFFLNRWISLLSKTSFNVTFYFYVRIQRERCQQQSSSVLVMNWNRIQMCWRKLLSESNSEDASGDIITMSLVCNSGCVAKKCTKYFKFIKCGTPKDETDFPCAVMCHILLQGEAEPHSWNTKLHYSFVPGAVLIACASFHLLSGVSIMRQNIEHIHSRQILMQAPTTGCCTVYSIHDNRACFCVCTFQYLSGGHKHCVDIPCFRDCFLVVFCFLIPFFNIIV